MAVSVMIVLMGFSFLAGASTQHRMSIQQGAEMHWKGEIECGYIGNTVFCAETGD